MNQFLDSTDLIETIVTNAEQNNEDARALTADLNEAQLNWKPSPEQWGIAQCLEHLAITSSKFDDYFSAAIERAREKFSVSASPAYKPSFVGGWLARQVDPVHGRNLRA